MVMRALRLLSLNALIDADANLDLAVFDFEPSQIRMNKSPIKQAAFTWLELVPSSTLSANFVGSLCRNVWFFA
jgi:hypothetical protein